VVVPQIQYAVRLLCHSRDLGLVISFSLPTFLPREFINCFSLCLLGYLASFVFSACVLVTSEFRQPFFMAFRTHCFNMDRSPFSASAAAVALLPIPFSDEDRFTESWTPFYLVFLPTPKPFPPVILSWSFSGSLAPFRNRSP